MIYLYVYTENNLQFQDIPEFVNSITLDDNYRIPFDINYIILNSEEFNDDFIKNDIKTNENTSAEIYLIMKENYVEVRHIHYSFDEFFVAPYKTIKSLMDLVDIGKLDCTTWITVYRKHGIVFDDHIN